MLVTERLLLRPWRPIEAGVRRELWLERDPRVPAHRRVGADGRPSVEELAERIDAEEGILAIELRSTGELVGYCGVVGTELVYELLQRHWGRGYATEAARAVVAASTLPRLTADVSDWNAASFRVLEKLGFVRTAEADGTVTLVLDR